MRGIGSHPLALSALVLFGLAFLVACAISTRRRALTFFFDGVPPLETLGGPQLPQQPSPPPYAGRGPDVASAQRPVAPPVVSVHQPVRERQCNACHDARNAMTLVAEAIQLCDQCHQTEREEQGWDHGPINLGTCLPCHRAHDSAFPHLLDQPVPDLCRLCHEEDMERDAAYHDSPTVGNCTACHDPHRRSEFVERSAVRNRAPPTTPQRVDRPPDGNRDERLW